MDQKKKKNMHKVYTLTLTTIKDSSSLERTFIQSLGKRKKKGLERLIQTKILVNSC